MMYKNYLKRKLLTNSLSVIVLAAVYTNPFMTYAQPEAMTQLMGQRIQSAGEIIKDIDQWKTNAQQLHNHTENIIAQAKHLQGEASQFEIKTPVIKGGAKLDSSQLQAARKQYQLDINHFAEHAKAYNQHLKDFQILVGECHANSKALDSVLQKYQLHITQFHLTMPAIRPPHICGALEGVLGNLSSVANQMMGDQIRVATAEAKLNQEEQGLELANGAAANLQTKAVLTAQRSKGEAQLASEFGLLQEEYDLLKSEKNTIDRNTVKNTGVALSSVSGKVIKKNK